MLSPQHCSVPGVPPGVTGPPSPLLPQPNRWRTNVSTSALSHPTQLIPDQTLTFRKLLSSPQAAWWTHSEPGPFSTSTLTGGSSQRKGPVSDLGLLPRSYGTLPTLFSPYWPVSLSGVHFRHFFKHPTQHTMHAPQLLANTAPPTTQDGLYQAALNEH